jgi:hypothetical protein
MAGIEPVTSTLSYFILTSLHLVHHVDGRTYFMGGFTAKKQLVLYPMLPILKIAAHDYTHFCPYRENRRALRLVLSSGAKLMRKNRGHAI